MAALAVLSLLAAGCTQSLEETSENGLYAVQMTFKGTPSVGRNEAGLRLRDAQGRPVEGAEIEVTPWMPGMNHGVPWVPTVKETGGGQYRMVFHLSMEGLWELRMGIAKGEVTDIVVFELPDVEGK